MAAKANWSEAPVEGLAIGFKQSDSSCLSLGYIRVVYFPKKLLQRRLVTDIDLQHWFLAWNGDYKLLSISRFVARWWLGDLLQSINSDYARYSLLSSKKRKESSRLNMGACQCLISNWLYILHFMLIQMTRVRNTSLLYLLIWLF